MATFTRTRNGTRIILVWGVTPEQVMSQLDTHLKHNIIGGDDYERACWELSSTQKEAVLIDDTRLYPLKFYSCSTKTEVWLKFTASSIEREYAQQALMLMGFENANIPTTAPNTAKKFFKK